ncbi:DtxR family transcriptional regulator [Bacteroidota bacterium]
MNEHIVSLFIGIFIMLILGFLFYPNKGLLAKWQKFLQDHEKIKTEDALKHVYNCEYNNLNSNINSIAGNLFIKSDEAARLVRKLESMDLLIQGESTLKLTPKGRNYALRIIRIHRLWEKYLAEETGVQELDWHEEAEKIEHLMSEREADKLAAKIGNPVLDPHGDPIPTPSGKMPSKRGISITQLKAGVIAKIVHLEDEPKTVYEQLITQGLSVGQHVKIIEISKEKIIIEVAEEISVLAPTFANNISVIEIPDKTLIYKTFQSLSDLKIGQKGKVVGISQSCRGQQRRRLLDLGVVPGTEILAQIKNMFGDSTGYKIKGATIALRREHARFVLIDNIKN